MDFRSIAPGQSGAQAYRFATGNGQQLFAKVVSSWDEIDNVDQMRTEFLTSIWAAQRGFAREVYFADANEGVLIAEFLHNEMPAEEQGGLEPRLSATLRTMHRLHTSEASLGRWHFDLGAERNMWEKNLSLVPKSDAADPFIEKASRVAEYCLQQLSTQFYDAVVRHGDLHQENVLFNQGKAWLIDWGSKNHGDAMQEVAYFAYHVSFGLYELDEMLEKYAVLPKEDVVRARYHLAFMHANRYLMTLRGMPWDLPEEKPNKLRQHRDYLIDDMKWFNWSDL